MTNKYIVWVLGAALVFALGAFVWLWKSQERIAPTQKTSETSDKIMNTRQEPSGVGETPTDKTKTPANLDDIAQNIGADANDDRTAIESEATSELGSLEEGNTVVNDLGKTYDESVY